MPRTVEGSGTQVRNGEKLYDDAQLPGATGPSPVYYWVCFMAEKKRRCSDGSHDFPHHAVDNASTTT